jgi:hypothetical protein
LNPRGLVHNWIDNVPTLSLIAKKYPIEFIDEENFVEGFDRNEDLDTLNAVCTFKPSIVRTDSELVCNIDIYL